MILHSVCPCTDDFASIAPETGRLRTGVSRNNLPCEIIVAQRKIANPHPKCDGQSLHRIFRRSSHQFIVLRRRNAQRVESGRRFRKLPKRLIFRRFRDDPVECPALFCGHLRLEDLFESPAIPLCDGVRNSDEAAGDP
jgi:hypothetical protein